MQGVRFAEYGFAPVGVVHARNDAEGVYHPHCASSRVQPVADLRQHLAGPIIWRQHLYGEIGRELGEAP